VKKHDEGYALVLVLVVVLVLNIAAMGLMTLTLNNLKTQRNLVDRMVDKYAAQGEIEIAVANLDAKLKEETPEDVNLYAGPEEAVAKWLTDKAIGNVNLDHINVNDKQFAYTIPLDNSTGNANTTIKCELVINGTVEEKPAGSQKFEVKYLGYQYASYEYSFQETSPSETTEGGATE
jgi:hypothetical protein